jgi:hypothetical protein
MEYGTATGLAQDFGYNQRINDQRFYDQQMKRAQAENEASLKAFEDDTDYMNAANSFDHNLIKANADKTIREMGEIIRNNPDYKYNPDVRRALKEKKVYLKSNPDVIRGMASDENFRRLNDDLAKVAKNPNMYDAGAYQELLAKKQNYIQYGHQDGQEAAKKFGAQAFVYDKPEDFVPLNEEALKTASQIKARKYKEQGNGGWEELVDENSLHPAAQDFYNRHKRQIQVTYNPKDDMEGIAYAKELIRPGIDLKRKFGEPHYNDALAVAKWKAKHDEAKSNGKYDLDPYTYDIKTALNNSINTDLIQTMLGTTPETRIYNKDGSFKQVTKGLKFIPTGAFQQAAQVEKKINPRTGAYEGYGRTLDKNTGRVSNKNTGVYHGYVEMTEKELDESGLLDDKAMDDKIVPFEGQDKKGNKTKMFRVETQAHVNLDDEAARIRYNSAAKLTNQQMNALKPMSQMQENIGKTGWTMDPKTGEVFDAQGNKRGTKDNYR